MMEPMVAEEYEALKNSVYFIGIDVRMCVLSKGQCGSIAWIKLVTMGQPAV
jgi:hypothetical protein